jgi:purine nucleosidase
MTRLILDTDIGSDLDDALALACIFGSPSIRLEAVTTVYGDTAVRAGIVARLCELAGVGVPIIPGATVTRSGREVWWAGFEGTNFESLESPLIREGMDATRFLAETVAAAPGEIDVLAIGPLTNIANALDFDPAFASHVRRLWVMGGFFGSDTAEHNFLCDADAARLVFDSDIPCTVTALEATTSVRLLPEDFSQIESVGPIGAALASESASFMAYTGKGWSSPHDPMALLPLLFPDRFEYNEGSIVIAVDGPEPGHSTLAPGANGPARVVSNWDAEWVRATVRELILAGCRVNG